ncbi:MAG: A/G-specific adenine glycosylase [Bacteroidales bacterium]|jgi:A/G-specific adenine glycosylase|nr:A/G-specific adenine glycosylase [Bacteroidales bacterium]
MLKVNKAITEWYQHNKRDLPWRDTKNPYYIWISEIILQQTRVDQGIHYYDQFIHHFPDIFTLANSPLEKILKLWQGLGYYSRARNMHYTANQIVNNFQGKFPESYHELIKLKGVGEYTAAAIASIAFDQNVPALDGNVYRVLSRVFGIAESTEKAYGKKVFKQKATELMKNQNPGIFNQALMEFGALQCTPKNPACESCVLNHDCFAFEHKMIDDLPLKKQKINQRHRFFNFLYIQHENKIYIEQRKKNDIWKLLYQFPLIETNKSVSLDSLIRNNHWKRLFKGTKTNIERISKEKIHQLSHQKLFAKFYQVKIDQPNTFLLNNYLETTPEEVDKYGVPKLIENFLKKINN